MVKFYRIVFALWACFLLLLVGLNWSLVWQSVEVNFLVTTLSLRLYFWLTVGALAAPLVARFISLIQLGHMAKQASNQESKIRAEVLGEREKSNQDLVDRIGEKIASVLEASGQEEGYMEEENEELEQKDKPGASPITIRSILSRKKKKAE